MAIYGCLIEIWNGSKFCKWRTIYFDHKHVLSLLHYNRHISSLTIRNHIDSKHCFTIWIKPSETFRNETKYPNRSPLPGRFGNQNKTHPVLACYILGDGVTYSFLRLWDNFICWWCSESLDVEHKTQQNNNGVNDGHHFLYLPNCGRLHIFHGTSGPLCQKSLEVESDWTWSQSFPTWIIHFLHLETHRSIWNYTKLDLQENDWFI